jgi:hypothetical protein
MRPTDTSGSAAVLSALSLSLLLTLTACGTGSGSGSLDGPFPGSRPPGDEPVLFAPGLVSTGLTQRDAGVAPDGRSVVFSVAWGGFAGLALTAYEEGAWQTPEILPFSRDPGYFNMEPAFAPDGDRIYFLSNRPADPAQAATFRRGAWDHQTIWFSDRTTSGWSEPRPIGAPVDGPDYEYFPSLARDGTLLYTRQVRGGRPSLWLAAPDGQGGFREPAPVDAGWNREGSPYNACLHPDGDRIILCLQNEERIPARYRVTFRGPDGAWSEPADLGDEVNRPGVAAMSSSFTSDGRWLLFVSRQVGPDGRRPAGGLTLDWLRGVSSSPENGASSVWWVDASFIDGLRP